MRLKEVAVVAAARSGFALLALHAEAAVAAHGFRTGFSAAFAGKRSEVNRRCGMGDRGISHPSKQNEKEKKDVSHG